MSLTPSAPSGPSTQRAKPGFALRKPVALSSTNLVEITPSASPSGLPVLIRPAAIGVDPFQWAQDHRGQLAELLHRHGGILLRDFKLQGSADFQRMLNAVDVRLMNYIEKATPREQISGQVYTSTIFPAEHSIAPHNELSYVRQWPGRIVFFCELPAASGGETPLCDVRRVLQRLDPAVADKFRRLGWTLVRNFGSGIGPSWQHSLDVENRAQAEDYLRRSDTHWEWTGDDRLRTMQRRAAMQRHPVTGEELWFNHIAFWHLSSMAPEVQHSLLSTFGPDQLPYNTFYGDGSEIPADVVAQLRAAYDAETVKFTWQAGDFLLLDNMLVAHGRASFTGKRLVLAAMGDEVRPASVMPPSCPEPV